MTGTYEWSGAVGDAWAAEWQATDLSFAGLTPRLDAAILDAAPDKGRAIDIGCGAGSTSIALAIARPHLDITGIDISSSLVSTARERATGIPNLCFETLDAQELDAGSADFLFSRHGVMFFADPVAGFTALRRAATDHARFVFSCFRWFELNRWAMDSVAAIAGRAPPPPETTPGPFAFADPLRVRDILLASGWTGKEEPVDYAYRAGEGRRAVEQAVAFFSRIGPAAAKLKELEGAERDAGLARVRALLDARRSGDVVDFPAAAWIWSCRTV